MSDRKRAALADLVDVHRGWCNYCKGNADWCMERDCSLARYLKSLAPAQPEGWVSVEDRLPVAGTIVIIHGGVGHWLNPCPRYPDGQWFTNTGCESRQIMWNVTHWMPLPSPPSGGEEKAAAQVPGSSPDRENGSTSVPERSPAPAAPSTQERAGETPAVPDTLPEAREWQVDDENTDFADGSGLVRKSDYDRLRQSATRLQAELAQWQHTAETNKGWVDHWQKQAELAEASRELEHFTKSGIVEIAVRNPSVMDYIKHWEGRAESAERTVACYRAVLEGMEFQRLDKLPTFSVGDCRKVGETAKARILLDQRTVGELRGLLNQCRVYVLDEAMKYKASRDNEMLKKIDAALREPS